MGNYNADPTPDTDAMRQVAFGYKLAPLSDLKVDQFSTDSSLKVFSLVKKIGSTRLQVQVDPDELPQ